MTTFAICAAEYDPTQSGLTPQGEAQIAAVRKQLMGHGRSTVILTSNRELDLSPQAQAVALTAQALGSLGRVIESTTMSLVARSPQAVRDIGQFITFALEQEGIPAHPDDEVVVVTQQPLIQPLKGREPVRPGDIVEVDSRSWPQGIFSPAAAATILGPKAEALYGTSVDVELAATPTETAHRRMLVEHPSSVWKPPIGN